MQLLGLQSHDILFQPLCIRLAPSPTFTSCIQRRLAVVPRRRSNDDTYPARRPRRFSDRIYWQLWPTSRQNPQLGRWRSHLTFRCRQNAHLHCQSALFSHGDGGEIAVIHPLAGCNARSRGPAQERGRESSRKRNENSHDRAQLHSQETRPVGVVIACSGSDSICYYLDEG